MSIEQLNQDYVVGKLTAFEAVVEILRRLDEDDDVVQLNDIAPRLLTSLEDYVLSFYPKLRATGPLPTERQVMMARKWIRSKQEHME